MPQKIRNDSRYLAYWWSDIVEPRKVCFSLRRKAERAEKRPAEIALQITEFLLKKKQQGQLAKKVYNEPWDLGVVQEDAVKDILHILSSLM